MKEKLKDWITPALLLTPHVILLIAILYELSGQNESALCNFLGIKNLKDLLEIAYDLAAITGVIIAALAFNHWKKPTLYQVKIEEQARIIGKLNILRRFLNSEESRIKNYIEQAKNESETLHQLKSTRESIMKNLENPESDLNFQMRMARDIRHEKYMELIETSDTILELLDTIGCNFKKIASSLDEQKHLALEKIDYMIGKIEHPNIHTSCNEPDSDLISQMSLDINIVREDIEKLKETIRKDRKI